ncbi:hypothetical protein PoB_005167500 [Plakobranchus ocellatus]|uniref:Uncharacterized protein n=1 Tax=Plakobranchus ocellatus TaxID=259542 RepID=A0AAV4C1A3_9GAST|nr:hypothetical protein PoB_005167500 [Plakobranchus ocellatus]
MSTSSSTFPVNKQSDLLDAPETMELTAPSPSSSNQSSPNLDQTRPVPPRRYRESIDGVQAYRDLLRVDANKVKETQCTESICMISKPQQIETSKNSINKKNGSPKASWKRRLFKSGRENLVNNYINDNMSTNENRSCSRARSAYTPSPAPKWSAAPQSSLGTSTSTPACKCLKENCPQCQVGNNSNRKVGLGLKMRAIGKFSSLENKCRSRTMETILDDELINSGAMCLMEHNPNRIFKVRAFWEEVFFGVFFN